MIFTVYYASVVLCVKFLEPLRGPGLAIRTAAGTRFIKCSVISGSIRCILRCVACLVVSWLVRRMNLFKLHVIVSLLHYARFYGVGFFALVEIMHDNLSEGLMCL